MSGDYSNGESMDVLCNSVKPEDRLQEAGDKDMGRGERLNTAVLQLLQHAGGGSSRLEMADLEVQVEEVQSDCSRPSQDFVSSI
jgi:hypothetical protein